MDKSESKKQKVLIVHNYYQIPGGEDTVVANEKKMLEEHGHEVILYSRHNSELKEMNKLQKFFLPIDTIFNLKTYREIKTIVKKEKIDIVHVHNTLNLISPSVYYASRACNVPVVQTIHNFRLLCPGATFYRDGHICEDCVGYSLYCAVKHKCYRNSRIQTLACVVSTKFHRLTGIYGKINYICLTEFNKEKLLELKQIQKDMVFVKPNFVESDGKIIPVEKRENRFIFVGRLDKLKGVDIMLEAWKQIGKDAPELMICGTGAMEEWCKDFIQDNKINNVKMLGFVPNQEIRKLVAYSKALILPTQWYEGFPMSIAESFSVGTPVLCSDLGNSGNLVIDGINGFKFKFDSSIGLIESVEQLCNCFKIYEETLNDYKSKYTEEHNYKILKKFIGWQNNKGISKNPLFKSSKM